MIFVQPLFDNSLNNPLSHTHMCFLFSLFFFLSPLFLSNHKRRKLVFIKVV